MRKVHCSLLCLAAVWFTLGLARVTCAQGSELPSEPNLNRVGLTMAWWAQAPISPVKERVAYLTADEVNVYVQGQSGVITTYHGETGRRLWSDLYDAPFKKSMPVTSNDEQVLVSIGSMVYSMNKMTGSLLWKFAVPDQPSTSPSLDEDRIYFGTANGSVYTYDLREIQNLYEDGLLPEYGEKARLWRFSTSKQIISPPLVTSNSLLFASQTGTAYGVSAANKVLKFQLETRGNINTPLAVSSEYLFVCDTNNRLYCLNQSTGRVRWIYSAGNAVTQQPRVLGNHLYIIPQARGMICLNIETGQAESRAPGVVQFVAASENRIYTSDISNNLVILDRADLSPLNSVPLRGYTIRVENDRTDRIVMSTPQGTVISLRELGSEYPIFHNQPERRPILPELAPEVPARK